MSLSALLSDERQIIDAILDAASLSDFLVSVYDGEEWALTVSDSRPAIAAVVGATDCTTLRFRRRRLGADGRPSSVGSVFLVHGNGCDVGVRSPAARPVRRSRFYFNPVRNDYDKTS